MTPFQRKATSARLAPQDAEYYYNESERHRSNVVAIYLFDSTAETSVVERAEVTAWMSARLGQARMFTHRIRRVPLDLDLPRWEPDPGVDPSRHVTVEPIEGPGWEPLQHRISRIVGAPLDLNRPPWELHVITGVSDLEDSPHRMTAVVLKFHHSAGDGIATRDLGLRLFGPVPEAARPPAPTGSRGAVADFTHAAAALPRTLLRFGRGVGASRAAELRVRDLAAAGEIVEPRGTRPSCRFNGRITPDLTFDHVRLQREAIDTVRAAVPGATVNDVVLATVSGALAAHLREIGEEPTGSLGALVPMSLRGTETGAGADTDGPRSTHLALLSVDLHTDSTDPLARLRAIAASARNEKARHGNEHVRQASRRIESAPAWLLRLAGYARRFEPHTGATVALHNTMVSNVPWAGTDLTFAGSPLVRILGVLGIVDGSGLRHLVVTSEPTALDLTFTTDTAMMPDTRAYKRLLLTSLNDLVAASTV